VQQPVGAAVRAARLVGALELALHLLAVDVLEHLARLVDELVHHRRLHRILPRVLQSDRRERLEVLLDLRDGRQLLVLELRAKPTRAAAAGRMMGCVSVHPGCRRRASGGGRRASGVKRRALGGWRRATMARWRATSTRANKRVRAGGTHLELAHRRLVCVVPEAALLHILLPWGSIDLVHPRLQLGRVLGLDRRAALGEERELRELCCARRHPHRVDLRVGLRLLEIHG
jgi:hypothetical protein